MFGFGTFLENPVPFNTAYRCYPVSLLPGSWDRRAEVENGGNIILPHSTFQYLSRLNVDFPMLFKLTNCRPERVTHCGVLEFVAGEGKCYIPKWMMANLGFNKGDMVQVETAVLPVAKFTKFEPQSEEFFAITNPKAMLKNALRKFSCLTIGDIIVIKCNDKLYELKVVETKPDSAVNIIDCELDVEFTRPADYIEPENQKKNEDDPTDKPSEIK